MPTDKPTIQTAQQPTNLPTYHGHVGFTEIIDHFLSNFTHFLDQIINIPRKRVWMSRKRVRRSRKGVRRSSKCARVLRTFVWRSMNVTLVTGNDSSAMEMYE